MYPSLFNDVFGPIMIGPSSSACAGPTRIGQIARGVGGGTPVYYRINYVPGSGRAAFRTGMATNLGLIAGVLGWGPDDPRLYTAQEEAEKQGMTVEVVLATPTPTPCCSPCATPPERKAPCWATA